MRREFLSVYKAGKSPSSYKLLLLLEEKNTLTLCFHS